MYKTLKFGGKVSKKCLNFNCFNFVKFRFFLQADQISDAYCKWRAAFFKS